MSPVPPRARCWPSQRVSPCAGAAGERSPPRPRRARWNRTSLTPKTSERARRDAAAAGRARAGAAGYPRRVATAVHKRVSAPLEHPSKAARAARGKAARRQVPRSSHAKFEPAPDRPDPIELLERQARSRVPELVPIRYGRMLVSPFSLYRGAALVMANDLAATPRSGLLAQRSGAPRHPHFGLFPSPDRRRVFDITDSH